MKLESCLKMVDLFFETLYPNLHDPKNDDNNERNDFCMLHECFEFAEAFFNQMYPDFTEYENENLNLIQYKKDA